MWMDASRFPNKSLILGSKDEIHDVVRHVEDCYYVNGCIKVFPTVIDSQQ